MRPGRPWAWPARWAARGAAVAFAVAGFSAAAVIAVAAETERAVIEAGGLASIGQTAAGAGVVGLGLLGLAGVLGRRYLVVASSIGGLEPVRFPGPAVVLRGLSGERSRAAERVSRAARTAWLVALGGAVGWLTIGHLPGEPRLVASLVPAIVACGAAIVALGLGTWQLDRVDEALTDRLSPFARPISVRRHGLRTLPVVALLGLIAYPAAAVVVASFHQHVDCPGLPGADCSRVTVALDHLQPGNGRTLPIVYRVIPARGARLGTLIVMTGGPGVRGLAEADSFAARIDPAVREHDDLVFFDQRGVGASGGLDCSNATRDWYAAIRAGAADSGAPFTQACLAEFGTAADTLPYLSTNQAAEDVEAVRSALGVNRVAVYAESYGTRLAQAYAALHPDHVGALVLDGAIDPSTPILDFWQESARGFASSLDATLADCSATPACRADVAGGDPGAALAAILDRLRAGPASLAYPDGYGTIATGITARQAIDAIGSALYAGQSRMELQRAIAAASHGDDVPLDRLVRVAEALPVIGAPAPRVGPPLPATALSDLWTPAAYYTIECADIDAPGLGQSAFEAAARAATAASGIFGQLVLQDSPCLDWPRPAPGPVVPSTTLNPRIPTLVLAATADPITPIGNAERIVARDPSAGLVVIAGGQHVTWSTGNGCADAAVRSLLLDGRAAAGRSDCAGRIAAPYVPLPARSASAFATEQAGVAALAAQLGALPEVSSWDGLGSFRIGCPVAGWVTFFGFPDQIGLLISGCSFTPGFVVEGNGSMNVRDRSITLDAHRTG